MFWVCVYWCFTSHATISQSYTCMWRFINNIDIQNVQDLGSEKRVSFRTSSSFFFFLLPVGLPAGLGGFVGCIDPTYLRDSLTNIRIRVLSPGRPSLGRMPHSPYYFFRGGVHISLLCPPSTCVCMCAVNAGACVTYLAHGDFMYRMVSTGQFVCLFLLLYGVSKRIQRMC